MQATIAAIATAHGVGSIAIVRLSGSSAYAIACRLSRREALTPRHATLSSLFDTQGTLIDEALVIYFQAPRSFTGEDVVELQCHGGMIVAATVLQSVLAMGARLSEPGEFSKRAFLNGRIDLSEAEAMAALIEAKSEDAARILARQIKGELRLFIEQVRDELLYLLAYSEVSIDYAEEDLPQDLIDQIAQRLMALHVRLQETLESSKRRAGLMQGFKVSLIGKPNVGKSSLLNALLRYNRAIVSDIAGTTRDTIEEQVRIGTHLIRMVDTAGIREARDEIERIGIERSIAALEESDIVVALFDASRPLDVEDEAIIALIHRHLGERTLVVVLNKSDLPSALDDALLKPFEPLRLSAKSSAEPLVRRLEAIMDGANRSEELMLISSRQIDAVSKALREIEEASAPLQTQELELFSFHLNRALHVMASITRPFENDEMLDRMFGSFCLGK